MICLVVRKSFLNFNYLNLFHGIGCYWGRRLFREHSHAMLLLYDPQVVLENCSHIVMRVLPAPVQMGPVYGLKMTIAAKGKL